MFILLAIFVLLNPVVGSVCCEYVQVNGTIEANLQGGRYGTQAGTGDAFSRSQLWHFYSNDADPADASGSYDGDGPILRVGALSADGDATTVIGEGAVFYGQNNFGGEMKSADWAFGRVKPLRFQLRESIGSVQKDVFRVDDSKLIWRETGGASDDFRADSSGVIVKGDVSVTTPTKGYKHASVTVNQTGSLSGTVVADSTSGRIRLYEPLDGNGAASFAVNCSAIKSDSVIMLTVKCVVSNDKACTVSIGEIVESVSFGIIVHNEAKSKFTIAAPIVHFFIVNPV